MAVGRENRRTTVLFRAEFSFFALFSLLIFLSEFKFRIRQMGAQRHRNYHSGICPNENKKLLLLLSQSNESKFASSSLHWNVYFHPHVFFVLRTVRVANQSHEWTSEESKKRFISLKNMFKLRIVRFQLNRHCVAVCNCGGVFSLNVYPIQCDEM